MDFYSYIPSWNATDQNAILPFIPWYVIIVQNRILKETIALIV